MPTVDKSIEIDAPIERVFQAWTSYETFPEFMKNVEEVRRTGPNMTHWVAKAAGRAIEWDAKTTVETNRRIAWTAEGESGQSGEVTLTPLGTGRTKLDVHMDYTLDSKLEELGSRIFGVGDMVVAKDLESFKEMVERGGFAGASSGF